MCDRAEVVVEKLQVTNYGLNKKYFWLSTTNHFITDFYNGFLAPLLPFIAAKLNLSLTQAGMLLSIFSVSNSLTQPIIGFIDDRLKRNYFILFGPLITGIFIGFLGCMNQYWTLIVILVMAGIGTSMFHPPGAVVIGRLKNNRKGFSMSIFNTAGALGISTGALIIVPVTNWFGLKSTIFTVIPAILLFFYSYKYFMPGKILGQGFKHPSNVLTAIKPHSLLLLNLFLIVVIRATIVLTFSGYIPFYLIPLDKSGVFGSIALAVFLFFTTVGILIGGHLYDRIGTRKILIFSFIFVLPFALAFINLPSTGGLPFLAIMGFFLSSSTSVNIVLAQEIVPSQASLMSSIMMGFGWGIAGLFMYPIGAIADAIGLYWSLTIISCLSLVGLKLVYVFRYKEIGES